ncbi:MAG: trigger factor [Candidatus Komeilibacteria bacterium]|nr:trigger factor [Candidatus Komeilibacteria bacterium]
MQITNRQTVKGEIELTVSLTPLELSADLEWAASKLSEKLKVPGFRPGHVPYEVIKQQAGEMVIWEEAVEHYLPKVITKIVADEKIDFWGQPKVAPEKLAPGNEVILKITFIQVPEVTVGNFNNIKIETKPVVVEDAEVDKVIEDIRGMRAEEKPVERPAALNDLAIIDFEVKLGNVPVEGGSGKDYPLVLGSSQMVPGFEEAVIGLSKGESKEFQLKFPEEYASELLKGKMTNTTITLKELKERILPVITDDWAKTVGAENLADLKEKIKDNLKQEVGNKQSQDQELSLLRQAVAACQFGEIADGMVEEEIHRMMHEFEHDVESRGLKFADYLLSIKKTETELEKDFHDKALDRVKTSLLLRALARQEKIEANAEEIQAETDKILGYYQNDEKIAGSIKSPEYQHYLGTVIKNQKVITFLKEQVIKK